MVKQQQVEYPSRTVGLASYSTALILSAAALGSQKWSTMRARGVDSDGFLAEGRFVMGLWEMFGSVTLEGIPQYRASSYVWCANGDRGPIFDMHQQALCRFLQASRVCGVLSILAGVVGLVLCALLALDFIRTRRRRLVATHTTVYAGAQFVLAVFCWGFWVLLHKVARADLQAQYPGAGFNLRLNAPWIVMFLSSVVSLACAVDLVLRARKEPIVDRQDNLVMEPKPYVANGAARGDRRDVEAGSATQQGPTQ